MAIAVSENSASITTTEYSLPANANYASGSPQTTDAMVQIWIDLANMVAGDEYRFRLYEKVTSGGTQRLVDQRYYSGPQSCPAIVIPGLILLNGWDATLLQVTGSARTIGWSIRRVE